MTHWISKAVVVFLVPGSVLFAAELRVRTEESVLAVVTHKGGFASGMAHNHLIVASEYDARLELDEASITATTFDLRVRVGDLVVDDPELQSTWFPRIRELGILDDAFGEVSEGDREKIRGSMLGKKQLDAEAFPEISASVVRVREADGVDDDGAFRYRVTLAVELHGKRIEREVQARLTLDDDDVLSVEAFGAFEFTDFGIKPYSAFLGAVKNLNEFHVYVRLAADRLPGTAPT